MAGTFVRHMTGRELAQLVIDQGQQLRRAVRLAVLDRAEEAGDLVHEVEDTRREDCRQAPHAKGVALRASSLGNSLGYATRPQRRMELTAFPSNAPVLNDDCQISVERRLELGMVRLRCACIWRIA
jgi:hypothetical protein